MFISSMWKNFTSVIGAPLSLSMTCLAFGPWIWIAVVAARHRLAHRARGRAVVALHLDVELAGLAVELDPVDGRRAADEIELVLGEMEQDAVADDVAVIGARHELLGAVHREIGEAVDGQIVHELERVRPRDHHLGHVMRLVEQHGGLAPRHLLVAPVGELGRHHRIDISAELRIAQHLDRVTRLQHFFQILFGHLPLQ